ncbi:MAG TPA: DUF1152 domain-containing protein [Candidatus Paceibacterota bacterium]|nr:DUF1152 domain-containing protein [Candidatus Paceibacterota bacterium]
MNNQEKVNINAKSSVEKKALSSVELVKNLTNKYPEMEWLTGNVDSTPEASISGQVEGTVGKQIFSNLDKKDLIEFDRTAVGILTLYWADNGDYDSFTACQKEPTKLTKESFKKLQEYSKSILQNQEDIEAMETFMVINDLGKIKGVVENITEKSGIKDIDHDKMLLIGLEKHPEISPSFQKLSSHHKELILNGLKTKFNIGQFIRGESMPASLEGLKDVDQESLRFYLLHSLYDMAGAAGQFVQNGSVVMTEPLYKDFSSAVDLVEKLGQGKTADEAYNSYLNQKAENLGFNPLSPEDRAMTRICCMLSISNIEQAQEVKKIFSELPKNTHAILEADLNKKGTDDGLATLIYYAPSFLLNLQKKFNDNKEPDAFKKALSLGLTTLARVFQEARIANKGKEDNGIYTVMASSLAKVATENPDKLSKQEIKLKIIGNDAEVELIGVPEINKDKFTKIANLTEISGKRIIPIGIGGGSDCIQASLLAEMLKKSGKECPCVVSIRTEKTESLSNNGKVGDKRVIENYGEEIKKGVYLITPETTGSGRFLENIPTHDVPVYLVIEQESINLSEQINFVLEKVGGIDTIVAVDTGGDALYSSTNKNEAETTPNQDLRSLKAINDLSGVQKISCEIAVGIDTPANGESILLSANAKYYEPTTEEIKLILEKYKEWQMDGSNDSRYGKTPLAWQKALQDKFGFQEVDLPTKVVLDKNNPWKPFIHTQPSTKGMFFMDIENHLRSINH